MVFLAAPITQTRFNSGSSNTQPTRGVPEELVFGVIVKVVSVLQLS